VRDGAAQVRAGGVLAVVAGARTVAAAVAFYSNLAQAWRFEDARLQWFREGRRCAQWRWRDAT